MVHNAAQDAAHHLAAAIRKRTQNGFIPNDGGQNQNSNTDNTQQTDNQNQQGQGNQVATTTSSSTTTTSSLAPSSSSTTSTTTTTTTTSSSSSSTTTTTTTTSIVSVPTTMIVQPTTPTVAATRTFNTDMYSISSSASATATAVPSSSPPVGTLVGIIGGGLVGLVVLAAIAGYFFRRAFHKKDDFDRNNFVRNSMALPDDTYGDKVPMGTQNALALAKANSSWQSGPSETPRPPTMIERRGFQPGQVVGQSNDAGAQAGYYGAQDPNAGYYGYDQGYAQGQYAGYDQNAAYYNTSAGYDHAGNPLPVGHDGQYYAQDGSVDPRHQSVTPYQQQQYEQISAALGGGAPNAVGAAQPNLGRSLSSGYQQQQTLNRQPSQPYQTPNRQPSQRGGAIQDNRSGTPTDHNPQQTYFHPKGGNNRVSVVDEEDAYGGM